MKPLKIAALGFAGALAVAAVVLTLGVPAGFVAKLAQDQVESATGYRLRIDGGTKLAFRPSPTVTPEQHQSRRRQRRHFRDQHRGGERAGLALAREPPFGPGRE